MERLHHYRDAIHAMQEERFHLQPPTGALEDPVVALGLELAQLGNWLEGRFLEFRKLQAISLEITSAPLAENVLDSIYDAFSSMIPFDRIGCALLTEDGSTLRAFWARAEYAALRINRNYKASLAGSSLQAVLATGQPRILNDLEQHLALHPHSVSTRLILQEGIRSSLTCPLIAGGKPLGFLFFSSRSKDTYHHLHPGLFLQIAEQVSILIEKSLLYQNMLDLNQKLTEMQAQLKEKALHDDLTKIFNRGAIFEFLERRLNEAQRKQKTVAVIMADLDHFKTINDQYGHLAGDAVLRATATALQNALRRYDHVGRYGGEEFLIVLDNADVATASEVATRLRVAIDGLKISFKDQVIYPKASFGIAIASDDLQMETLLARADDALYQAKHDGRNCCRLWGPETHSAGGDIGIGP